MRALRLLVLVSWLRFLVAAFPLVWDERCARLLGYRGRL